MPSIKTHDIFYKELIKKLDNKAKKSYVNYTKYNLFAQGHDILLYNNFYKLHKAKKLKNNLHFCFEMQEKNFQEFIYNYLKVASEYNLLEDESIRSFITTGYISHHILDSVTHPFIVFYAGDHSVDKTKETWQHGIVENLLDMYFILKYENKNYRKEKFNKEFIYRKKDINKKLYEIIDKAIFLTYGKSHQGKVYKVGLKHIRKYVKFMKEDKSGLKAKLFDKVDKYFKGAKSFSYNRDLSDIHKYLNKENKLWVNPFAGTNPSDKSFEDLFDIALDKTAKVINDLESCIRKGDISRETIYKVVPDVASNHGLESNVKFKINYTSKISVKTKSCEKEIIKKIDKGYKLNKKLMKFIYTKTADNFTTKLGMNIRKIIHPLVKFIVKKSMVKENIILKNIKLDKKTPYIFVPTHSFDEDLKTTVASIDRNAYLVLGLTEQIKYNPDMYMTYLGSGMIHIFKDSKPSRRAAREKMEKVLKNNNCVIIYPEGAFNHSQNALMLDLYDSIFDLAKKTGAKIVPITSYSRYDLDKIYTVLSDPMSVEGYKEEEKEKFMETLKDELATQMWLLWESYAPKVKRENLGTIEDYYHERMHEYLGVLWDPRSDVWVDEEIVCKNPSEQENINNFKKYVKANWRETQEKIYLNKKIKKTNKKK